MSLGFRKVQAVRQLLAKTETKGKWKEPKRRWRDIVVQLEDGTEGSYSAVTRALHDPHLPV